MGVIHGEPCYGVSLIEKCHQKATRSVWIYTVQSTHFSSCCGQFWYSFTKTCKKSPKKNTSLFSKVTSKHSLPIYHAVNGCSHINVPFATHDKATSYIFAQILIKINQKIAHHLKKHPLEKEYFALGQKKDFKNLPSARCESLNFCS